ncbi:MAG: hypothetical protein HDQ97_19330 [Lachnospiraceae bacterium]|nr:hypothetical protein [Lachnospiraceae bacterium]
MEIVTGEVININNEYRTYQDYKAAVDSEMQKSAESFVRIGYLLKLARDTDILKDTMYGSVNEFAQAEYGLDKSQVSRFIRINDEYSEGGYSDQLKEQYRGYGYAKLALMLLLPVAVAEEISSSYSKSEIQAIKEEVYEEKKITDIEVLLEGQDRQQASMDSTLHKVIHQLGHDQPELYVRMLKARYEDYSGQAEDIGIASRIITEILAPCGEAIHNVRLQGIGRMMLSIKGADRDVVVVNMRSGEKESFSWQQMISAIDTLVVPEASPEHEKEWEILYGETFPAREEPKKPEPSPVMARTVQKKPSKVTKAKTEKKVDENAAEKKSGDRPEIAPDNGPYDTRTEEPEPTESHPESYETDKESDPDAGEEQLPGQMQLEKDFPEYCPDAEENTKNMEVAPVQPNYTEKHEELGYYITALKEIPIPETGECAYIGPAADRLAEYERTGITPEQIIEIDRLYSERCREIAELKKQIKVLQEAAGVEVSDGKETP